MGTTPHQSWAVGTLGYPGACPPALPSLTRSWGDACGGSGGIEPRGGAGQGPRTEGRGRAVARGHRAQPGPGRSPARCRRHVDASTRGAGAPPSSQSEGGIQMSVGWRPMRREGVWPHCPQFPRRASFKGELGGQRGAGSRGGVEVLGALGSTGSSVSGCLAVCMCVRGRGGRSMTLAAGPKRPMGCGSADLPIRQKATVAGMDSDVGLFLAAFLAGECLGSRPV